MGHTAALDTVVANREIFAPTGTEHLKLNQPPSMLCTP
jgi:hypothetical protein